MSITDELREYVQSWRETPNLMDDLDAGDIDGLLGDFIAIADRIDIAHKHAIGYVDDRDHDTMAENGWVRLPKDADGKVWRIGDELLDDGMVCEVVGIGPNRLYYYVDATDTVEWTQADGRRHYHAPTVEDVLREFGRGWHEQMNGPETFDIADYVERYAAKLRLAGDAE